MCSKQLPHALHVFLSRLHHFSLLFTAWQSNVSVKSAVPLHLLVVGLPKELYPYKLNIK